MTPNQNSRPPVANSSAGRRLNFWYGALVLIMLVFIFRLFWLQIVRHDHYRTAALSDQLKQYSIAPQRGIISVEENGGSIPIVLNQELFTLYADPTLIKNASSAADKLSLITKGDARSYSKQMRTKNTRYVVLARQLTPDQNNKVLDLKIPGIGTQGQDYRTYPQGSLASQLLGFVNNSGVGQYGLEQAMNSQLAGKPGSLKAITDANGVPLAASRDNVKINPVNGDNIKLTIDLGMQSQMEKILQAEYQKTKSQGLSAIIMDPNTGQIKAMANYPTYDPTHYQDVDKVSLFENAVVDNAIEPGSSMKNLTTAAALNLGVIQPSTTFYDPAHWVVDDFNITDIEEDGGAGTKSIGDILNLSLNTGATWELMQMGGGQINQQARNKWYDYMANHYRLGKPTGVEQGYEASGYVPNPNSGYGLNLTYANTSFGQGITLTALQMSSALSSVLNGGTYYKPTVIASSTSSNGTTTINTPKVVEKNVVKPQVGQDLQSLMEYVVAQHYNPGGFTYLKFPDNYVIGGKTGTAQVANPKGGYYTDRFNGTYAGFVGGDKPQYVIVVFNVLPAVAGYAGSYAGQPVFGDLAHMLINDGYVIPKNNS